jgi:hypothetical protein
MGANQSKSKNDTELKAANILDILATKYILTQNFKDMKNLGDKEHCNKLVILTADIIKKFLKEEEVTYWAHRVEDGVPVNKKQKKSIILVKKMNNQTKDKKPESHKKRMYYPDGSYKIIEQAGVHPPDYKKKSSQTPLNELDVKNVQEKDNMCRGIAKFYIKIAHIFAAILKTVNPIYKYGEHKMGIMNKSKIPKGTKVILGEENLCNRRIKTFKVKNAEAGKTTISVNNCDLNKHKTTKNLHDNIFDNLDMDYGEEIIKNKTLGVEVGIPEFQELYFDIYDFDKGKFTSMSKGEKRAYGQDLKTFYKMFTGKNDYKTWNAQHDKKFSDIPLKDYHNSDICKEDNSSWKQTYKGDEGNPLFKKFAENVKEMLQNTNKNQQNLLQILDKIFIWEESPSKVKIAGDSLENKRITINPKLNNESLQKIVVETRKLIIAIYLECEKDYQTGLKLFEAIVGERMLKNSIAKKKEFESKLEKQLGNVGGEDLNNIVKQNIDTALSNPITSANAPIAGGRKTKKKRKKGGKNKTQKK